MASNDDLKKLRKAQQKRTSTSDARQPWQEFLSRDQSVHASKAVQAAEVLGAFSGSWAAQVGSPFAIREEDAGNSMRRVADGTVPPGPSKSYSRLGKPGLPEINFPPYDWNTNRGGNRGPALLGHPISFSIVGPTAKSPTCDWQWRATDNSGSIYEDSIELDSIRVDGSAGPTSISQVYGITDIPDEGLYLVISLLSNVGNQVPAHMAAEVNLASSRNPIGIHTGYEETAGFEVFRVVEIYGDIGFKLALPKRLSSFFSFPGGLNTFRAITLFKPHVTRLVPIPDSNGAGRESVYLVVPPERAANSDLYPAYSGVNSWLNGDFEPTAITGSTGAYNGEVDLPIPNPKHTDIDECAFSGTLEAVTEDSAPSVQNGTWRITNLTADASLWTRKVVRIFEVTRENISAHPDETTHASSPLRHCLGYFEVVSGGADEVTLYRVPSVDPQTGEVFHGPGPYNLLSTAGEPITVRGTLHDRVADLFTGTPNIIDPEALEAVRLTNLIDPSMVGRTAKYPLPGAQSARPDRAIFDTATDGANYADPGSLLDLGFRMVLFPGKHASTGTNVAPDFDHPITSLEVVIDPSITNEQQYLDIDYSAGLVTLSHPPPASGTGGQLLPNGIIQSSSTGNNPQGRCVLYAACVPFSMEPGQAGAGVQVTSSDLREADWGHVPRTQSQAFGQRTIHLASPNQTVDDRPDNFLNLEEDIGVSFPPTGYFQASPENPLDGTEGTYGYTGKESWVKEGTQATASLWINGVSTPGGTLVIGGGTLTAVAGAPGVNEFQVAGTPEDQAVNIRNAINNGANTVSLYATATIATTQDTAILLTAVPVGTAGNGMTLTPTSIGASASSQFVGGLDITTATRLTGIFPTETATWPLIISTAGEWITLRRETEADFELDTAYGSSFRTKELRLGFSDITSNADGSITVTPRSPAEELRANYPLGRQTDGSFTDIARLHLSSETQNWTIEGPEYLYYDQTDIGLDITRGKLSTTTSYQFDSFRWKPWVTRAKEIAVWDASNETPQNELVLKIDSGAIGFRDTIPKGFFRRPPDDLDGLCAVVEGATVISAKWSSWAPASGQRLVLNVKKYGDRAARDDEAERLLDMDEAPANPLDWIAVSVSLGDTAVEVAQKVNAALVSYGYGIQPATWTPWDSGSRLMISERQIDILPSRYYLKSKDVSSFVTFNSFCRYSLTIYSAVPDKRTRKRWITFEARPDSGFSYVDNDANAIAAFLNGPLYDSMHPNYIGAKLDEAGFFRSPSTLGVNPDIAALPTPADQLERSFLWAGPNDSRHPDGSNTVCLICGGHGSKDSNSTFSDFFNVMVEFHQTRSAGTTRDVGSVLEGDFEITADMGSPRCGLFYGSYAAQPIGGVPGTGLFPGNFTQALANETMGFSPYGLRPLGGIVGSWEITDKTEYDDVTEIRIMLPQGQHDLYNGPQNLPFSLTDEHTYDSNQRVRSVTVEPFASSAFGYGSAFRNTPYLGRWMWPEYVSRVADDLNSPSFAGIAHIWVSYGATPHDERGFSCFMTEETQRGYSSFVAYGGVWPEAAPQGQAPQIAPGAIQKGDRVLAQTASGLGDFSSFEGVILDPEPSILNTHDWGGDGANSPSYTVLCVGRGYSADEDYRQQQGIQPNSMLGIPWSVAELSWSSTVAPKVSIIPDPSAVTLASSAKFLHDTLYGPTTISGLGDGSGLDGGSVRSLPGTITPISAMATSGGRINLMSTAGPNLGAGISFTTPVLGSTHPLYEGLRFTSTFIEHGVFTTSVSLGKLGFGTGIESGGAWDAHRLWGTRQQPHGTVGGHSVGGVAGIRVSGDAQLWLTNVRPLRSEHPTAWVRLTNFKEDVNSVGTGPALIVGGDGITEVPPATFRESNHSSTGAHIPSGWGAARREGAGLGYTLVHQEATVVLGLTSADWRAMQVGAPNSLFPGAGDAFTDNALTDKPPHTEALLTSQMARLGDIPIPVPFLSGTYLKIGTPDFLSFTSDYYANEGIWRVVGTPMVTGSLVSLNMGLRGFNFLLRYFPHTPHYLFKGYASQPEKGWVAGIDVGHAPTAAFVGFVQVRVERWAAIHVDGTYDKTFYPESIGYPTDGHPWQFAFDVLGKKPVFVADVVDPGGSPTGAPSSLRGMTLNPQALGEQRGFHKIDLVSVFKSTGVTEELPSALRGQGRLFGIHEVADRRGRQYSMAYFGMDDQITAIPAIPRDAYARMTVYTAQRDDRLDESSKAFTEGEFQRDASGRVVFVGHKRRLSAGILMDGGLGLVQATSFRATPRPTTTDTLGALTIWGHNATWPLARHYNTKSQVAGISLPSSFNKAEFHDTLAIVGPNSSLIFENSRASYGLPYNLRENEGAVQSWQTPRELEFDRNTTTVSSPDLSTLESIYEQVLPNDSLFPYGWSGIKFRSPGTVVYERPFRALDAQGGNAMLSSLHGRHTEGGIKGIEIPTYGEALLLPKGPPTPYNNGVPTFWRGCSGATPLDTPLYEFINGVRDESTGMLCFPISPGPIFDEFPVGSYVGSTLDSTLTDSPHYGTPGCVFAGYRHIHSREVWGQFDQFHVYHSDLGLKEQLRVLPGMVIEDVTNGTFYTIGDVGRWKNFTDGTNVPSSGGTHVNCPGNDRFQQVGFSGRPNTLGDVVACGGEMSDVWFRVDALTLNGDNLTVAGVTLTAGGTPGWTPTGGSPAADASVMSVAINNNVSSCRAWCEPGSNYVYIVYIYIGRLHAQKQIATNATSRIKLKGTTSSPQNFGLALNPEIIYDLGPLCDPLKDVYVPGVQPDEIRNGFGDRQDNQYVRRPLCGHTMRIVPNVEFVPVMGPRGVTGGLLPPHDYGTGDPIPNADAVLYDIGNWGAGYQFKTDDIGRFVYICGTDSYIHTGWWIITDVRLDYPVSVATGTVNTDVAVVRKWRRGPGNWPGADEPGRRWADALPLGNRSPRLTMCADMVFNDSLGNGAAPLFGGTPSDLVLELTNNVGTVIYSVRVNSATLVAGSVVDCDSLATFANGNANLNGTNVPIPGTPKAFIRWYSFNTNLYDRGANVEVYYYRDILTDEQWEYLTGENAQLRIQFRSDTTSRGIAPYNRSHNVTDNYLSIGFYSLEGHNSQLDRGAGDRNNSAKMGFASSEDPNTGGNYEAYSAAQGIRWVFSSPLTEEHVGSFLHLTKPSLFRYGSALDSQDDISSGGSAVQTTSWTSGWPRYGDPDEQVGMHTDIYRINRCPTTNDLVIGGDCEMFWPEIIKVAGRNGADNLGKGRPILYSPLGVMGNWPDTYDPKFLHANLHPHVIQYALQPIAREKIVTVSPRAMRSNMLLGHSGLNASGDGPDGIGPAIVGKDSTVTNNQESTAHILSEWWVPMNRLNATRTRLSENRTVAKGWPTNQHNINHTAHAELFNSNDPDPSTPTTSADSDYTWTPGGEYWYLNVPKAVRDSYQYDASCPPPTLMVDLTEAFTQAMQPGGGINSPYPGHAPKGVRLTRIWVNFGLWGKQLTTRTPDYIPGYAPRASENDVLKEMHMCFNLILEIPGSRARVFSDASRTVNEHPLGSGTAGLPFGDRAPTASYTHPDNSPGGDYYPGGTIVVPLYINREAGDLMPNVMERWLDSGPKPVWNSTVGGTGSDWAFGDPNPAPDWVQGDYEFGFGVGGDANYYDLHSEPGLESSSSSPVVWGGIDTATFAQGGAFTTAAYSRALASPFPRSSRVGGGVRSAFTSGIVPDGSVFKDAASHSLHAAALTGIVIAHGGKYPAAGPGEAGSFGSSLPTYEEHAGRHCSHAFTCALTPVGDYFETPKDGSGNRIGVDPTVSPSSGSEGLSRFGRMLTMEGVNDALNYDKSPAGRPFKVGNWLDSILERYSIPVPSGSMMPPGARVYLEITAGPGTAAIIGASSEAESASGCWVGGIKCAFEVETADGTAYTTNVNYLGEDGS